MGQTLTTAANWTTAKEGTLGKLEFTPANEYILNRIISFVKNFSESYSEEAKFEFRSPLIWTTNLLPNDFAGGYTQQNGSLVSDEKTYSETESLFTLIKSGSRYEITVYNFEFLEKILKVAGERQMSETRACLEANPDPMAKMLGDRFSFIEGPDSSVSRFIDEIMRVPQKEADSYDEDSVQKQRMLKILLLLKDFDVKLLQDAVKQISNEVRLNPLEVERIVELLDQFSGDDEEKNVLEFINFMEPYTFVFNNKCRAPVWRQVHGDISYIEVKPHDCAPLSITASTNGYFINKGIENDKKDLNFEKVGDYYKDLVMLLREKSPNFSRLIDQQDFTLHQNNKIDRLDLYELKKELSDDEGNDNEDTRRQPSHQVDLVKRELKSKTQKEKSKKLEPSLKWKNLGNEKNEMREDNRLSSRQTSKKRTELTRSRLMHNADEMDEPFEESSSESEEEEEVPDRRNEANSDLPSEYWQIQKLVKYLKGGNQTATIIALCAMRDFNLSQETCQLAIRDVGGLEVLINLLDTDEIKCKIGSLMILKEISQNPQIRRSIADLGGLQTMVKISCDPNKDLKCLAAETIANVAKFRRARRTVRQHGGIRKLVGLLDCAALTNVKTPDQEKDVQVARCGALALWSCSKSTKNKQATRRAGAIPLLARLLKSPHEDMLIPVVGTLQECATEPNYRLAIRTEGMIEDLVQNLKSENQQLQMHCASAIFKCAEEKETRDLVRQYGGLDPLVILLQNVENKELLAAATGAIWKCAISSENVVRFKELKAIDLLVNLLNDQPEQVLVNVVGALAELAKETANRMTIRKAGGIPLLVNLLTGTNQSLLVNVTKAVGQCAEEPDNMIVIDKLDGVRLLWSLLKNQNTEVQASAAWAICPCIENAKDAGEMVRSFVGGLELIVSLLKSDDQEVLASVCAAIANIAVDEENLAVITDHGVVAMLAKLTNTTDDRLRRHLAEAVARCCNWGNNREAFGEVGAVAPLVKYLRSKDLQVHRATAKALHQLSKDAENCISMHESDVVKPLMEMVGSQDDVLQEAAAGCIANIRRLALANEKSKNK